MLCMDLLSFQFDISNLAWAIQVNGMSSSIEMEKEIRLKGQWNSVIKWISGYKLETLKVVGYTKTCWLLFMNSIQVERPIE